MSKWSMCKCYGNCLRSRWRDTWASYQICKIAGCACAGNAGNVSPRRRIQRKLLVSDPGMHHGTCVTHVPWCMSGSLTHGGGENVPGISGASAILRIWQEAHWTTSFIGWDHIHGTWSKLYRSDTDPDAISRCCLTSWGDPTVEKRLSYDHLISAMGFPIEVKWHLHIWSGPIV